MGSLSLSFRISTVSRPYSLALFNLQVRGRCVSLGDSRAAVRRGGFRWGVVDVCYRIDGVPVDRTYCQYLSGSQLRRQIFFATLAGVNEVRVL